MTQWSGLSESRHWNCSKPKFLCQLTSFDQGIDRGWLDVEICTLKNRLWRCNLAFDLLAMLAIVHNVEATRKLSVEWEWGDTGNSLRC